MPHSILFDVRSSPTTEAFLRQANTNLGRYDGRCLSSTEVDEMDWDMAVTYIFGLYDGTAVRTARRWTQEPNGTLYLDVVA